MPQNILENPCSIQSNSEPASESSQEFEIQLAGETQLTGDRSDKTDAWYSGHWAPAVARMCYESVKSCPLNSGIGICNNLAIGLGTRGICWPRTYRLCECKIGNREDTPVRLAHETRRGQKEHSRVMVQ